MAFLTVFEWLIDVVFTHPPPPPSFSLAALFVSCFFRLVRLLLRLVSLPLGFGSFSPAFLFLFLGLPFR